MVQQYISEKANIDIRPIARSTINVTNISLGDLHGNAIKLMYFLVREEIVDISADDYQKIVAIYKTPQKDLTKKLLADFNKLVAKIKVINPDILVRLIGDEIADRGANDYFVLKVLQAIQQKGNKANICILLSNHGAEFVQGYENYNKRKKIAATMMLRYTPSLFNLNDLIERKLVDANEIFDIVNTSYKPALKLLDYSLDLLTGSITIYSHAGIGIEALQLLAKKFKIAYLDSSSKELATTIDNINNAFKIYVDKNQVQTLFNQNKMQSAYSDYIPLGNEQNNNAVEFILWNRDYSKLTRPEIHNNYPMHFVHGHDSNEDTSQNITNLDNQLGKAANQHTGEYTILASGELPLQLQINPNIDPQVADTVSALPKPNTQKNSNKNDREIIDVTDISERNTLKAERNKLKAEMDRFENLHPRTRAGKLNELVEKIVNDDDAPRIVLTTEAPSVQNQNYSKPGLHFMQKLCELEKKSTQLLAREGDISNAYHSAFNLYIKLRDAGKIYFTGEQNEVTYKAFQITCETAIKTARPVLETHRGWKEVLGNIAIVVSTLGFGLIPLIAIGIYNQFHDRKYHFFATDSAKKISEIEDVIVAAAPAA